jgi:hypothetical protein
MIANPATRHLPSARCLTPRFRNGPTGTTRATISTMTTGPLHGVCFSVSYLSALLLST